MCQKHIKIVEIHRIITKKVFGSSKPVVNEKIEQELIKKGIYAYTQLQNFFNSVMMGEDSEGFVISFPENPKKRVFVKCPENEEPTQYYKAYEIAFDNDDCQFVTPISLRIKIVEYAYPVQSVIKQLLEQGKIQKSISIQKLMALELIDILIRLLVIAQRQIQECVPHLSQAAESARFFLCVDDEGDGYEDDEDDEDE